MNRRHRDFMGELAARPDVTRPRLIGSILAFDVKAAGAYQSTREPGVTQLVPGARPQYQAARANDLPHAALLHHRRGVDARL